MNGNGALKRQAPPAPQPQQKGIFVPRQYIPDTNDRSLELRINSEDDAKSVIQNLQAIKNAYDSAGNLTSVEFVIAESIAKQIEHTLLGAICWCRTYTKHVAPQPGNVLFVLPAYRDLSVPTPETFTQTEQASISSESPIPVNATPQAHVKPQRPVRAEPARQ